MKKILYSVLDTVADVWSDPFVCPTPAVALRGIADCVRNPLHPFHAHPDDYALYEVGEYDCDTGVLTGYPADERIVVCRGFSYLSNVKEI